jgi:predicted phosphodiesterase
VWECLWCRKGAEGDPQKPDQCEHCETPRGAKSPNAYLIPPPKPRPTPASLGCRVRRRIAGNAPVPLKAEVQNTPDPLPQSPASKGSDDALEPVLIVSDAHIPYHSAVWWDLLLQVGRFLRPTLLVIIGDFADFYSVSAHDKSAERANRFSEELDAVEACLDQLDDLGARDKVYVEGNHEDRLRRYLMTRPELSGVLSTDRLLNLAGRGWEFVPYKHHTKRGAVHYTHDVGAAGRNAVFRALDTYQHSVVSGHTHRMQYVVEGSAVGDCKLSATFGWGGDVEQVDYMTLAKARKDWALGFGVGYIDPESGYTYLTPVPVVHGTCVVNGRLFRAAAA